MGAVEAGPKFPNQTLHTLGVAGTALLVQGIIE